MRAFVSYSVVEKQLAGAVKRALENLGVECFLAHEDIQVSEEWKTRILQELREVDIFVTLLSAKFKASEWCSQELGFIVSRPEVVIVPFRIDETLPYGFISHLQGRFVSDEESIPAILEDLLYRTRPRELIALQIGRVSSAGSFRAGEAAVRPLVPHFRLFTDQEVVDFTKAVIGNYEVWDASLCRSEYLPKFVAIKGKSIPDAPRRELKERVETLDLPDLAQ